MIWVQSKRLTGYCGASSRRARPAPPARASFGLTAAFVATVLWSVALPVALAFDLPAAQGLVNDHAAYLSGRARRQLTQELLAYRQRTGHELVFLTVPSVGTLTLDEYAHRVAVGWQLGHGAQDYVLVLIALRERTLHVVVGDALGGALSEQVLAQIERETLDRTVRRGSFAEGVLSTFQRMARTLDESRPDTLARVLPADVMSGGPVHDSAELLSEVARQHIVSELQRHAQLTESTLGFLSLSCPPEANLDEYADRMPPLSTLMRSGALDQLVVVVVQRLEHGVGFKLVTSASIAPELGRRVMAEVLGPALRRGDADRGVDAALAQLSNRLGGAWQLREVVPTVSPARVPSASHDAWVKDFLALVLGPFVVLSGLWVLLRSKRDRLTDGAVGRSDDTKSSSLGG